jgi:hypothetical protein
VTFNCFKKLIGNLAVISKLLVLISSMSGFYSAKCIYLRLRNNPIESQHFKACITLQEMIRTMKTMEKYTPTSCFLRPSSVKIICFLISFFKASRRMEMFQSNF